jgi:hypothetical protein
MASAVSPANQSHPPLCVCVCGWGCPVARTRGVHREQLEKARRVAVPDVAVEREKRLQKLVQEVILREDAMWGCVVVAHTWSAGAVPNHTHPRVSCAASVRFFTVIWDEVAEWMVHEAIYAWLRLIRSEKNVFVCACGGPSALCPGAAWRWPPALPRFVVNLAWRT